MAECIFCKQGAIDKSTCANCDEHDPTAKQLRRQLGAKRSCMISHDIFWVKEMNYPWWRYHKTRQFAD